MLKQRDAVTDTFAMRNGEKIKFYGTEFPDTDDYVLGIMRRSVSFPDGKHMETVNTPENNGKPVAFEAVIACHKSVNGWVWVQLSPSTKEILGSLTEEWGLPVDTWGYVGFSKA